MCKRFIFLPLLLLVLYSCSSTYFIIEADYQDQLIKDKSIAIVFKSPEIENEDDVADDIGESDSKAVFDSFFVSDFPEKIAYYSYLNPVLTDTFLIRPKLVRKRYKFSEKDRETQLIDLPEQGTFIELKVQKHADVVLYIYDFKIWRNAAESGIWMPGPNGTQTYSGGKFPDLEYEAKFFFWDNKAKKLISYVQVNVNATFAFAMSIEDWQTNNANLAKMLIKASPFANKVSLQKKYIQKKKKNGPEQPDRNNSYKE